MRVLILLLALLAVASADGITGPGEYQQPDGVYCLSIPSGWSTTPGTPATELMMRKDGTGLQPRLTVRLEKGGYTPTKDSVEKDFEQFEKLFPDHQFKLTSVKKVKVGKMAGFRLVGTEKGPKVYTTHVMQKLAMPDGRVLNAHGRAESASQQASSASKELLEILDSMRP
ncbi:MAG: hypothetical protein AB7S38_22365 [Vulcanimicrobiota bacterium]